MALHVALAVVRGPDAGKQFVFDRPGTFVVGRAADADARLSDGDPYVSRRHLLVEVAPPICRVLDLRGLNPAFIDGEALAPRESRALVGGEVLRLGFSELRVQVVVTAEAEAAVPVPASVTPVQEPLGASHVTVDASCSRCGRDLRAFADTDGRSGELAAVATYLCAEHVRPERACRGIVAGEYEAVRRLGEGGMAAVHLAYHRPTARLWALKRLRDGGGSELIRRFGREVQLHRDLAHEHVLRSIDHGRCSDGRPFLVTEYASEGNLESWFAPLGRPAPEAQAIDVARQVLQGLAYIHAHGIVHRDVKPQNVLLAKARSSVSGKAVVKIADFGLAYSLVAAGVARFTAPNTAMGSLLFMPPEQVRDAAIVGPSADIYATGAMLYYWLTRAYPFQFPTPDEVEARRRLMPMGKRRPADALRALLHERGVAHPLEIILSERAMPIRQRRATVPTRLAEVVDRALQREPRDRFASAAEMIQALEGL